MSDPLHIAMQLPDDNVQKFGRKMPTSLTSQIAALEIGECASKVIRVDTTDLNNLAAIKKGQSDSAYSSVKGAKTRTGLADAEYTIETSHTVTNAGNIFAMAIITRTA